MVLSFFITLSVISFGVTAQASTAGFSYQSHSSNGDSTVYMRGAAENEGSVATYTTLHHPTREDVKVIVATATDGRETVVKNVYDSNGQMIDCDVRVGEDGARQFVNEVESNIQALTKKPNTFKTPVGGKAGGDILADVQLQAARCENFLQARADEAVLQQRVPVELEEDDEVVEDEEMGKRRQKRAYLIWPGTNWCGKGSKAEFAESYGEHLEADKCCQKHDQCPYIIEGFTTKYNLFNYRIHTLSICDCDEKFVTCLKAANTSTATMVGKVFFNVVNTECFDLKLQKSCSKRSWWGGCEKYTTKWTASVRSLGNFPE